MKILVLNNSILAAGEFTETSTEITTADAIYPKHVIAGYQIIEAELPADYAPGRYTYDGEFVSVPEPAPIVPVPQSVSMRQARLALLAAGLLDDITEAIQALGQAAAIEWEYATEVRRDSPLIAMVQANNDLTDTAIDDLFREAATL
jgi:hypothetical protein